MAYVPHIWTVDDYVNPENLNHMEQGIDARFQSFNLQGGSATVVNGYYLGIIQGSGVITRTSLAFIRITNANAMQISYLVPSESTDAKTFSLSNYVLTTNGTTNGNVALIKLD